MKAYAIYWLKDKNPTFFADETARKACYQAVRVLNDLGFVVQFKDLRVKRAFEHDDIAGLVDSPKSINYLVSEKVSE